MERSQMLKLMYKLNKIFIYLNKYIIPIITAIASMFNKDSKILKTIHFILKLVLIINIVLGVGFILYFTDFTTPINNTFSLYYDLLEPYIELIKNLWNKLINYINNLHDVTVTSTSKNELADVIRETNSSIKTEFKAGIKEGIKETLDELLNEMNNDSKIELFKQISLYSSFIFFGYFLFVLPSNPESITEYNFVNQSLIEVKVFIKDFLINLFFNPTNPGNPGPGSATNVTPTAGVAGVATKAPDVPASIESPITSQLNKYYPNLIERGSSGNSVWSEGSSSTITPNTPTIVNSNIVNPLPSSGTAGVAITTVNVGIQTNLDGLTVRKQGVGIDIYEAALPSNVTNNVSDKVNEIITKIWH
jgi:hypothetical protein